MPSVGLAVANGTYNLDGTPNLETARALTSSSRTRPTPTKVIRYVALEGPESGTYFRGSARVSRCQAIITVPEDFRMVTDEERLTVQLTSNGASASMWIVSEDLNQIVVRSSGDIAFHYMVNGVRRSFKDHQPIKEEAKEFMPLSADARMPEGLTELQKQRLIANGTFNSDAHAEPRGC